MMLIDLSSLIVGSSYDRKQLSSLWGYSSFHALGRGVVTPKGDNKIILFVTQIKQSSFTQYQDHLDENFLYMEGETSHQNDIRLVNSLSSEDEIYLFYREKHHSSFTYFGQIFLFSYELRDDMPSHFIFSLSEYSTDSMLQSISHQYYTPDNDFTADREGIKKLYLHTKYERSNRNRQEAINIHGTYCHVCGFNFNSFYGHDLAKDYIEIHHVTPLSECNGRVIDPSIDLIPLCANCHRMIHRSPSNPLSIQSLKDIIANHKQ